MLVFSLAPIIAFARSPDRSPPAFVATIDFLQKSHLRVQILLQDIWFSIKMSKLSSLGGLVCLLALLGVAHGVPNFVVKGQVYCDTCAAGFVTRVSTYISGAKVAIQCKDHAGKLLSYTEGETDATGTFRIPYKGDHSHDLCEAVALSSPTPCNIPTSSNRGPVFLTDNNGINSDVRISGPFGFKSTETLAACPAVMQEYNVLD